MLYKSPRLWYFVMAALANKFTYVVFLAFILRYSFAYQASLLWVLEGGCGGKKGSCFIFELCSTFLY